MAAFGEPSPDAPSSFFKVLNDAAGSLAKVGENYYDVLAAKNEATLSAQPATKTPKGTTPGTSSPEAAIANSSFGGVPMKTIYIIGGVSLAIGLVVALALRRK